MSVNRRAIWLVFAFLCPFITPALPLKAQALTSSSSTNISQPAFDDITDVFIGKGLKGPYMLSWKNIENETDSVIVSGQKLARGKEYTIDYTTGAVVFNEPLKKDEIARVTFRRVIGKAQANNGTSLPMSLRLLNGDRANVDVLGFYNAGDGRNKQTSASAFGLSSGFNFGESSSISSTFITSQRGDSSDNDANLMDRSAMKLGASTSFGLFNLKGSFERAGEQFTSPGEYGFQHAKQLTDLCASLGNTSGPIFASFSFKEQEDISNCTEGATVTSIEEKVALNLQGASKITASHATTEIAPSDGQGNSTDVNTLQLEKRFGSKTSASATLQKSTSSGSFSEEVQTMNVKVNSNAVDNLQLNGGLTTKNSDVNGSELGFNVGMRATPNKRINLDASHSSINSDINGQQSMSKAKILLRPINQLDLSADVSLLDANTGGQTAAGFRVAVRPIDKIKLEGNYSGIQADQGDDQMQRAVHIEASPSNSFKISAGLSDKEVGASVQTTKEAAIEVVPAESVRLSSSYTEVADNQATTRVRNYSGSLKPVNYFEVSGGYKNRSSTVAEDLDTTSVQMALSPDRLFKLTGQYAYNPEGSDGNVERLERTSLGLDIKLGILGINGGFAQNDEYIAGRLSLERQIGFNVPLFGHGKLLTGFKMAESMLESQESTTTYTIGYTHVIGQKFNLSLTGELTRWQSDVKMPDQEYKATAKLGIKF
jgi:hypothetical protein